MSQTTLHNPDGAFVDVEDHHLLVKASTETEFEHVSEDEGLSFAWSVVALDIGAAGTILLVQNDDSDKNLHINRVSFSSDLATELDIHLTDEAVLTPAGTAVVGVCLNRAAPKVAEAIAKSNETNNVQGNIIWANRILADTVVTVDFGGAVILRKGQSVAVDITTASTSLINCNIMGYYD